MTYKTHYGIALYKNGAYQGRVAHRANLLSSRDDAKTLAQRLRKAHAGKHDYRAVAFIAQVGRKEDGYLIWTEEKA